LPKTKSNKGLPTAEEFLCYKPKRLGFEWSTADTGLVTITVPKFTGKVGKSFTKLLKRDNTFSSNLDKLGSTIWKQCDGEKTVKEILDVVIKEFPCEKNLDQRLFLFLQQLKSLGYITY
jgi:hypothetical protein